jgi:DNA-directed RNA polymerase specialized sigma24 family protein
LIAWEWFSCGVAPVRIQLVALAYRVLGDPWCASELAETTVHRLWARYGESVGRYPSRRVLKKAMWVAEELKSGDWRRMKYPSLYLALDSLDEKMREQALADPNEYPERLERQLMLDSIDDHLRQKGPTEIRAMYRLIRRGYSWQEIADELGVANSEVVKRRFYRWRRKVACA